MKINTMNMPMIKLIYGNNGDGKSLYSEKQKEDKINPKIILDSAISDWYKDKKISEFNYLTKDINIKISKLETKITSAKSTLTNIDGFKFKTFKLFLKDINFNTKEEWKKYKLEHYSKTSNIPNIPELIDLYNFIKKNEVLLRSMKLEQKELLILLKSFNLDDFNYQTTLAKQYNDELKNIKDKIKLKLTGIEYDLFKEINLENLKRLFNNLDNKEDFSSNIENEIKDKIVNSDEYLEIIKYEKEIKEIKENCIKFKENKDYVLDDAGYSINIDLEKERYSQGQKAIKVLEIIIKNFKEPNKTIILDDFFEKLDTSNQEKAINLIADSSINFEILTHDVLTVGIIQKICNKKKINNEIKFEEYIISFSKNKYIFKKTDLTITFKELNIKIWNNIKPFNEMYIFAKVFGRTYAKAGAITGSVKNEDFKINNNSNSFLFSSENIFHYSNDIDYHMINKIFSLNLTKNTNSISLLNEIKFKFIGKDREKNNNYGLSFEKIGKYIDKIIKCLEEEEKFYEENFDLIFEKKKKEEKNNTIYKKFWAEEEMIKPIITKSERDKIIHQLDNSLLEII